jgi:hypothetical protein
MARTTFSGPVASDNGFIGGTVSTPIAFTTSGNMSSFYGSSSAATGDTRLNYSRLDITSTGSGETFRALTRVSGAGAATGGTVNGAHISLSVNSGGSISGAGNALRATLGAAAGVTVGGTVAVLQLDSDLNATATVPAATSFLRVNDTSTTKIGNLMNIPAPSNGTIFATHTTQVMTHSIRIVSAAGTNYYVMCTDAATNRG